MSETDNGLRVLTDHLRAAGLLALLQPAGASAPTAPADLSEQAGPAPVAVLRPTEPEHVRAGLRAAAAAGLRVLPVVANTNTGGLAVPTEGRGCVMLDLRGMNRILELNRDDRYLVIEPGVTWQQVRDRLDRDAPELRMGYPLAPPDSSVLAGCILDGLSNLSLKHGSMNSWIIGLEVVLPSGESVVTGTRAWAPEGPWCSRGPLPDLTGLFLNFQGATGIVVRAAIQVWRKPAFRRRFFCLMPDLARGMDAVAALARSEVCDDLGSLSWPLGRLLMNVAPGLTPHPDEPQLFAYADISGEDREEIDLRERRVRGILRAQWPDFAESFFPIEWVIALDPAFRAFADFPTRLGFLLDHPGGGLSWVGTYGPLSRWREGAERAMAIMVRMGFPPEMVARPMHGGHYCVLRFVATFDRGQPDQRARVRAVNEAVLDEVLPMGFLPYKTPRWALQRHGERIQAGYRGLLRRIVDLIDPTDLCDSGRWRL